MCLIWISWLCPACQVACGRGFDAQCQLHCEACCADPEIKNFLAGLILTYCRASLLICFYTAAFIQLCQVLHSNLNPAMKARVWNRSNKRLLSPKTPVEHPDCDQPRWLGLQLQGHRCLGSSAVKQLVIKVIDHFQQGKPGTQHHSNKYTKGFNISSVVPCQYDEANGCFWGFCACNSTKIIKV